MGFQTGLLCDKLGVIDYKIARFENFRRRVNSLLLVEHNKLNPSHKVDVG